MITRYTAEAFESIAIREPFLTTSEVAPDRWAPHPLDGLNQSIVNAQATSALTVDVQRVDGLVKSQATQLLTLKSSSERINRNYLDRDISFDAQYVGLANGISAFNWQGAVVIDSLAGNGNWVNNWMRSTNYYSNIRNMPDGFYTLSMDILYEWGELKPPLVYLSGATGSSYQALTKVTDETLEPSKWYRYFLTVYKTGDNLNGEHLGFGDRVGRLHIKNVKLETGKVPTPYNAAEIIQSNALQQIATVVDGVKANYMVKMETNGVIGGFGMVQEIGALGSVKTSFGVNADTFFIGSPSSDKKPFIQKNDWSVINGVWVPPGTYIDTAFIADATISNAQIGTLSADKITAGSIAADRMKANIVAAAQGQFTSLSSISATIGVLRTKTTGKRMELTDEGLFSYDEAGRLRGFFGARN